MASYGIERLRLAMQERRRKEAPAAPELMSLTGREATWRVRLREGDAFMCARSNEMLGQHWVVMVDALRFNRAWLSSHEHCVPRSLMPADRKYRYAAEGFQRGAANPVPLAWPNLYQATGKTWIRFTNGVTRTLWLLANDAAAFPVRVESAGEAALLEAIAGLGEPHLRADRLFEAASQ